ncbi:SDR family NAD(P)-dependent oxidoreductase [Streptomyces noursei]|uniref:SDR family NAD(P)-dependent oxidoreductase n=1 Tax=Streptomyces noursei TaxID=1971 RepID=UPI0023B7A2D1|nr:SDR family NAD(P)-dependent oxidoreductase [Streptomyces noursei]
MTAYGRLDSVVLNAGIERDGTDGNLAVKDWEEPIRTNLTGPLSLLGRVTPV